MPEATSVMNEISGALSSLSTQIQNQLPDYPSFAEHWGWQQPGATRQDLIDRISKTINVVNSTDKDNVEDGLYSRITKIPATINFLVGNTLPNMPGGNFYMGYMAIISTLEAVEAVLDPLVPKTPDWQEIQDKDLIPAKLKKRLDTLKKSIGFVEDQTSDINERMTLINEAYHTANALPASLAGIEDAQSRFEKARDILSGISDDAKSSLDQIEIYKDNIEKNLFKSKELTNSISEVYSAATRQGLGKSFQDRADSLKSSTYILMIILAASLGVAGFISHKRINFVEKLFDKPNWDLQVLWANVFLTGIGVAAPIWFAWLLTKQISQRFRLAEDYGFKASVAKAYEGYRRETEESGDPALKRRLLSIALDRVQEAPLAHIERDQASTPFHDLVSSLIKPKKTKTPEDE